MSNYSKESKDKYLALQKQNFGNPNCQCACCHKSMAISESQLAFPYREKRIGKHGGEYSEDIYAYRVCPQCKKEIEHKESVNETKSDKRLKYLGFSAIIYACVYGLGQLLLFLTSGMIDGKTSDAIATFLGLWLFLPIPIMILSIVGVVCYIYIYDPIMSRLKPKDGIDFDEALRLNAVHWYTTN